MKKGAENKKATTHEEYVRAHKLMHHKIAAFRVLIFVIFLLYWEVGARLEWFDAFFFSSPSRVIECIYLQARSNGLLLHILITLMETWVSFLLVMFLSLLMAIVLWYFPKVSDVAEPYLVILNSLPKSALAPLFIVWLGTGTKTIIIAGISVAIFGSVISFYTAFRQVDPEKIILIQTFGGNKKHVLTKVVLPFSIPVLLSAAKVNIGLSLVGVIIGEFLAARKGLGYLIIYGSQVFQLDMVISSILILCIIALLFYKMVQQLEHHIKKRYWA